MQRVSSSLYSLIMLFVLCPPLLSGQPSVNIIASCHQPAVPLDSVSIACHGGETVIVCDGQGHEYMRMASEPVLTFCAGGALGAHVVSLLDKAEKPLAKTVFRLDAHTEIHDKSKRFFEFNQILLKTMRTFAHHGVGKTTYKGREYPWFVMWILDHAHTAKGMQFYEPHTGGLVDLLRLGQREDGMIWSNVHKDTGPGYYDSAYGPYDYCRRSEGLRWTRQPVENHCEYNFVDALHRAWQGSGDDAWMMKNIEAAMRALDYSVTDRARWSEKYKLLKRGYTIDSWDFQVMDEYTVEFPLATKQNIDADKTKFGIFFGDNTGYAHACDQLAEMLEAAHKPQEAARYRQRGRAIRRRLDQLAWNGRFFTHHIAENPDVIRSLGVDEKSQIAMSNAYSLNRGISHAQCTAILNTYQDLRKHLPKGSPGEWYAIYPPFQKGFGEDGSQWQYMNGGVHGHAAGELARGAFEHGFEDYGANILLRLYDLARQHSGIVRFAYTGAAVPSPPPQSFTPIDISNQANMDLWDQGSETVFPWMNEGPGNDMRNLPVGSQNFARVPYLIPSPDTNQRRGAIAVSRQPGFPAFTDIPIHQKAGAVYLIHTSHRLDTQANTAAEVAGSLTFFYDDSTSKSVYVFGERHVNRWWFPELNASDAGIAWRGPNPLSSDVGVCWAALENPEAEKTIRTIRISASLSEAVYAVMGLTLADRMPWHPPSVESFGGPDNWAGGTCMLALLEGLGGIKEQSTAYRTVCLSPRWCAAGTDSVSVTARYAASKGYVSYRYHHDEKHGRISMQLTGSGNEAQLRVLLPKKIQHVKAVTLNGQSAPFKMASVEASYYVVLKTALKQPTDINVSY